MIKQWQQINKDSKQAESLHQRWWWRLGCCIGLSCPFLQKRGAQQWIHSCHITFLDMVFCQLSVSCVKKFNMIHVLFYSNIYCMQEIHTSIFWGLKHLFSLNFLTQCQIGWWQFEAWWESSEFFAAYFGKDTQKGGYEMCLWLIHFPCCLSFLSYCLLLLQTCWGYK